MCCMLPVVVAAAEVEHEAVVDKAAPSASPAKEQPNEKEGVVMIEMKTSMGSIKLELYEDKAPVTVQNFRAYIESGHYNGTVFHRVIDNFMIQGGGFSQNMQQKPTMPPIKNEADNGLKNDRGTIAMARTSERDSATSQFFINVKDNDFLNNGARDFGYAVFGKVVEGMDVVDAIKSVETGARDVPVQPVEIVSIQLMEE